VSQNIDLLPPTLFTPEIFQIAPNLSTYSKNDPSHDLFILSIETHLMRIVPDIVKKELLACKGEEEIRKAFESLCEEIPLFHYSYNQEAPYTIDVSFLNFSAYTSGAGRYIPDILCRWLLPGKILPITGVRSLSFHFKKYPIRELLFSQYYVTLQNGSDLATALKHIDPILKELRINILSVYYARYIVSIKTLSMDQKTTMIEEYISSLMGPSSKVKETNIHDQMQQILTKMSADEKYHEVKKNLGHLMQTRPKNFDRDVFYEIRHFMVLFRDKFTANRDPRHISRVIAFQYLFKKTLVQAVRKAPGIRHISLKVLKTRVKSDTSKQMVLGILIAMNFLRDTERFDKRHILEAVRTYVPNIQYVKDSYVLERSDENMRSIYLEIEKKDRSCFSFNDIKELKQKLSKEIKERVENVLHPIFMPRNEEEIIRNIIVLSKQLKYVRDIPQVIITYDKQTNTEIIFNIILVRLLKHNVKPLKDLSSQSHIKIRHDEVKIVGYLKRKYAKEANLFRIYLDKSSFFRKDFSLDLQKARSRVVHELGYLIGEFRDYNGGMIVKQSESLSQLRSLMEDIGNRGEFLLENFFYSLRPAVMQSILSAKVMKSLFLLLLDAMEQDFEGSPYYLKFHTEGKHLLVMISAPDSSFKEVVSGAVGKLKVSSYDLTSSLVNIYEVTTLGYAYRFEEIESASLFKRIVIDALKSWKKDLASDFE